MTELSGFTSARTLFTVITACIVVGCGEGEPDPDDTATATVADTAPKAGASILSALPLRALGTEPFWALDVDSSGQRFITPDDTTGIRFLPVAPTTAGDTVIWAAQNDSTAIETRIWPEKCSDGMSDREYPYAAQIRIAGTVYRGCADRRAVIAPSSRPPRG